MISNNLKIALRSLRKNRLFSTLNVVGLALGLTVAAFLFLLIRHERSFDGFHSKKDRIARVILDQKTDEGSVERMSNAPNAIGPSAREAIPAVENFARIVANNFTGEALVAAGEKSLVEEKLVWADPGLAEIFDIQTLHGDLKKALAEPNSVAFNRSAALRFFGAENVVGQTVRIGKRPEPFEIRAVYDDFPSNSTLEANMIGSFVSEKWANKNLVWSNASFETWLLLDKSADRKAVESQLAGLLEKNVAPDRRWFSMWLQPLGDVHFGSSEMENSISKRSGDARQVGLLAVLAVAVLLLACFNYMNLATANASERAREVGISKALGASKMGLAARFFAETGVLTAFSMLLAFAAVGLGMPFFNRLVDQNLTASSLLEPSVLLGFASIGLAVALLAGAYPSIALAAFSPKNLIKNAVEKSPRAAWFRRSLVTAQFAASLVLMVGTAILWQQMRFIQQKNLGFEPSQVVAITATAAKTDIESAALFNEIKGLSAVESACFSQSFPGKSTSGRSIFLNENDENGQPLSTCRASAGIEKTLGLQLLAGDFLKEKASGDTLVQVILSRKGAEYLGFSPEKAVGKKIDCQLGPNAFVRGVVEDFHSESLHQPVSAYAFHDAETEPPRLILVKLNSKNLPATMAQIEAVFKKTLPASPFDARFVDDHIEKLYRADRRMARVATTFCGLSVLVSCLGLFGLAAFSAARRAKEIGIRRTLGASVGSVIGLLTRDCLMLVALAVAVGSPGASCLMEKWLADFAFRIKIGPEIFVAAGLASVGLAFLTVSFQAVKAALADPVKSLRSE